MKNQTENSGFVVVIQSADTVNEDVSPFSTSSSKLGKQRNGTNQANLLTKLDFQFAKEKRAPKLLHDQELVGIYPNLTYDPAILTISRPLPNLTSGSSKKSLVVFTVTVTDQKGAPIPGVEVIAFESQRYGDCELTDVSGVVHLQLSGKKIRQLLVLPQEGFWPRELSNIQMSASSLTVALHPIDLTSNSILKHFMPSGVKPSANGKGVRVAVIDSGIDAHAHLLRALKGGQNFVSGEDPTDYHDNGINHGTHVAGIIASAKIGIAPEAELLSYRVFPKECCKTDTLYITQALNAAIEAEVDIINLSLGSKKPDKITAALVARAEAAGILVVAASGNEGGAVSSPASLPSVVAVGAAGNLSIYPPNTMQKLTQCHETAPSNDFIAKFSCHGEEINCAGPGVGVVSTVGTSGYQVFDGTSMACPAVSGIAAKLLSDAPKIKSSPRNAARVQELKKLLYSSCKSLNLQKIFQGEGVPS